MELGSTRYIASRTIIETLASGDFSKNDVIVMIGKLDTLLQEMGWEVRTHVQGRNASEYIRGAERRIVSAKQALAWAETHASFVPLIELIRYVSLAAELTSSVAEVLGPQDQAAAV